MTSLQDLLGQEQGDQAVNQISQSVGADPSSVTSAIQAALPMLLNGLASNASTPEGAQSLNNTLDQHHDGSILDNIGGLASMIFGSSPSDGAPASTPAAADAGGILSHIFGSSQGQAAQQVSNQSGLSVGTVAQIMMFLAPIVMGYLGRQKQQQGGGGDGVTGILSNLLGNAAGASAGGSLLSMASGLLDRNHDGSALDDIASMAFKAFSNK